MVTKNTAWINDLVQDAEIELIGFSFADLQQAISGFFKYGKGMNPAGLNFGDLIVYGTAKANSDVEILFKGEDFLKTDLKSARLSV